MPSPHGKWGRQRHRNVLTVASYEPKAFICVACVTLGVTDFAYNGRTNGVSAKKMTIWSVSDFDVRHETQVVLVVPIWTSRTGARSETVVR